MATQTSNVESQVASQANGKIPATMQAVVYRGVNDMRVETVPVPAIGPGELLIKVATCGICGRFFAEFNANRRRNTAAG